MWLPILGLLFGAIIGSTISFQIPVIYVKYMSVAVLASLDSVFGGVKAGNVIKSSELSEKISKLPSDEQQRIFHVIEVMIKDAEK
jgi:hypothetical protein